MTDICISKGATYPITWYESGASLNNYYVELSARYFPAANNTLFTWSTSGGQITVTGSKVTVWINPSGTSGLDFTFGFYDLRYRSSNGVTAGSVVKTLDSGKVDLIQTYGRL